MHATRISRMALCGTLLCAIVMLAPAALAYGEWHLQINGENAYSGSDCPTMNGADYIWGTFHWASSGLSFEYTYDNSHWYAAYSEWWGQYEVYYFGFTTDWPQNYNWGDRFIISAHSSGVPDFYCYF